MRLSISRISKAYSGHTIFEDCSWVVDREGVYVVMGPNGSGKSTLLRICALLEKPDCGEVAYFSGNKRLTEAISLKRRMTLVFPQVGIFNATVFDNIAYGLKIRGAGKQEIEEKTSAMLGLARLTEKRNQCALSLSSGEKQRLGIARALVIEPEVLFLDEPTASIDEMNARLIEEIILDKKKSGMRIIMSTHDQMQAERLADQILLIKNRKLEEIKG